MSEAELSGVGGRFPVLGSHDQSRQRCVSSFFLRPCCPRPLIHPSSPPPPLICAVLRLVLLQVSTSIINGFIFSLERRLGVPVGCLEVTTPSRSSPLSRPRHSNVNGPPGLYSCPFAPSDRLRHHRLFRGCACRSQATRCAFAFQRASLAQPPSPFLSHHHHRYLRFPASTEINTYRLTRSFA